MKAIKILYWSQITLDNTTFTPVFFFTPSLDFLTYIGKYGYLNVPISISKTNGLYDGNTFVTIDKSTSKGGYPNDDNGMIYSATLNNTEFNIYPYEPFIGEFKIGNLNTMKVASEREIENKIETALNEPYCGCNKKREMKEEYFFKEDQMTETKKPKKKTNNIYIIIFCFFLIIIIILIVCFYGELCSKKKKII